MARSRKPVVARRQGVVRAGRSVYRCAPLPAPRLATYPVESVVSEKFEAMVKLGIANSRMKDLYDIWLLEKTYRFDGDGLARAIAATFARRGTPIPAELPDALTRAFGEDPAKIAQWAAFTKELASNPKSLGQVIDDLAHHFRSPSASQSFSRTQAS